MRVRLGVAEQRAPRRAGEARVASSRREASPSLCRRRISDIPITAPPRPALLPAATAPGVACPALAARKGASLVRRAAPRVPPRHRHRGRAVPLLSLLLWLYRGMGAGGGWPLILMLYPLSGRARSAEGTNRQPSNIQTSDNIGVRYPYLRYFAFSVSVVFLFAVAGYLW